MNRKIQTFKYLLFDSLSALFAWRLYLYFHLNPGSFLQSNKQSAISTLIVILIWLILYFLNGTYRKIYRKSRLKELSQTFIITVIGSIFILLFLPLLLPASVFSPPYPLSPHPFLLSVLRSSLFLHYFLLHFVITFAFRFWLTSIAAYRIQHKIIGFNTIIVGSSEKAVSIYKEIENQQRSSGNKFIGYVNGINHEEQILSEYIPLLGNYTELKDIIADNYIEEVIIALDSSHGFKNGDYNKKVEHIIAELEDTDVIIYITPGIKDIIIGSVRMGAVFQTPLIQISQDLMPFWQQILKRGIDIVVSFCCLIILSPVYLIIAIFIKRSSPGPVFYSHERIGLKGKPFIMHKFRSMYIDAEAQGPQLSCSEDKRVTPFGRFMRKIRLDEIPQFYNVLKGDMSLVGPRPERQFFIDLIKNKAPYYRLLHKVKPGITSWGQVKFGYAENVEEMIERLKYEILYIENISLAMDLKILIYTLLIILQGRGK